MSRSLLHTEVCDQLGIRYPILLAGMGGTCGPQLTAAVSNAGGLGILGAALLDGDGINQWVRETRALTSAPFGIDTLLPGRILEEMDEERLRATVPAEYWKAQAEIMEHFNLSPTDKRWFYQLPPLSKAFFQEQIEAIIDNRVPVYAAGLGNPAPYVEAFHKTGTKVIGVIGNVRDALRVVEGGADLVVAQGSEAGGHSSRVATMALVPSVVTAVAGRVPVVAAGGIADGRGIAAALALGAKAVWMGTRFVATDESCSPQHHKDALVAATEDETIVSRYFSGKPVRLLRTAIATELEKRLPGPLPMPQMALISGPIMAAGEESGRLELSPGLAGQVVRLVTRIQPAAEVMREIVGEAEAVLESLGRER